MASLIQSQLFIYFLLSMTFLLAIATDVSYDGRALTINGKRRLILSGSIHYPRSTPAMWPDLIKKGREGGLDAIETYVFWNAHEPVRRQYDFSGNNDLIRFLRTVQESELYVILRIGPYVCAEWNYGGFPVWLHNMPGIELRTANNVFMNEMKNFTSLIVNMVKKERLFASQGGPIIIAQIENEYGNVIASYGDAGKAYRDWCANMAVSQNVGVPWIMCQDTEAPEPMISACNGWYCDQYYPKNPSPKMWTENWTGWFKNWGGKDPHRTAEDLAYSVARFFQLGGTLQNYYMYHGGTNFGRTAGGPYITTSYDYDAPLDEFGNLNQPKWGHLKVLHQTLHSMERTLTHGKISTIDMGNSITVTKYTTNELTGCFISNTNTNTTTDATVSLEGNEYFVPAWSVSILPECKTEVYNTAKVNVQTTIMVKKPNEAEPEPGSFNWSWMPEKIDLNVHHLEKGDFSANMLIDQKAAASDASDYLWYRTEVHLSKGDPIWSNNMTLRVNASGHVLHVYVNGHYLSSKWATYGIYNYVLEEPVKLKPGKNLITLLSATVGFQNYGPYFDMIQSGIPGPVELVSRKGDETIIKDLSSHKWAYKVGLSGVDQKGYFNENRTAQWRSTDLPINSMMTWYKTTFKPPLGTEPVVVDLQGMGKGHAWVNSQSLGRYWPSYVTDSDGCSPDPCDYRGSYTNGKCVTNCGKPTQQHYHVPRSFLRDDENTLVLFEELGGDPAHVSFKTVTVGKACVSAAGGNTVVLACQGGALISDVEFASYGDPKGACGAFYTGACRNEKDVLAVVREACVGKEVCSLDVSDGVFGEVSGESCLAAGTNRKLAVQVAC